MLRAGQRSCAGPYPTAGRRCDDRSAPRNRFLRAAAAGCIRNITPVHPDSVRQGRASAAERGRHLPASEALDGRRTQNRRDCGRCASGACRTTGEMIIFAIRIANRHETSYDPAAGPVLRRFVRPTPRPRDRTPRTGAVPARRAPLLSSLPRSVRSTCARTTGTRSTSRTRSSSRVPTRCTCSTPLPATSPSAPIP